MSTKGRTPNGATTPLAVDYQPMSENTARALNGSGTGPELDKDDVFSLLSNQRRRLVIRFLHADGPMPKAELAERIAAVETDKPINEISSQERKRVLVSLHQCHLSKLEDHGVVTWNGEVSLDDNARAVLPYVDTTGNGFVDRAKSVVGRLS